MSVVQLPPTPYLAVDLAAFDRNAGRPARAVIEHGGKRWRPHVKSLRSPQLIGRLASAGATGVTVATLDEAARVVAAGIDDVLIANEIVCADSLARLAAMNRQAAVRVCVDTVAGAGAVSRAACEAGLRLPVLVDVDVGMQRCGVAAGQACVGLAQAVAAMPGLALQGLMAWEGHSTRIAPGSARAAAIREAVSLLVSSARACERAGLRVPVISCGGTGTYTVTSAIDGVTEVQAGGGVFGDRRARIEWQLDLEAALVVWTTVISRPTRTRVVCDGGWKAVAPFPVKPAPVALETIGEPVVSAEHAVFELREPDDHPDVGAQIAWEVGYADSTTILHDQIVATQDSTVVDVWRLPAHRNGGRPV